PLRFLVERNCKQEARDLGGLGYVEGDRLDMRRAESSEPRAFALDAAGNGVFTDPMLAVEFRNRDAGTMMGRPSPFSTRKLGGGGRRSDKRIPHARVEGSFRDEHGEPLPNVPVCALVKADGRRRDTHSDEFGRFSFAEL